MSRAIGPIQCYIYSGAELILQAFRRFTYVIAHSPTIRRFTYVTAHSPTLLLLHLRHSPFSNPSFASPTSHDFHLSHLASRPWCDCCIEYKVLKASIDDQQPSYLIYCLREVQISYKCNFDLFQVCWTDLTLRWLLNRLQCKYNATNFIKLQSREVFLKKCVN